MYLPRVVKVAVDQASFHFDKLYSYVVPDNLGPVERGCRVTVPFGGGNRRRQAVVMETDTAAEVAKLKPVYAVLDKTPLLSEELLELALWLKERTFCTVFDAVRTMLPTGFSLKLTPCYRVAVAEGQEPGIPLSVEEKRLLSALADYPDGLERPRLLALLGLEGDSPLPERLVERGVLWRTDLAAQTGHDASVKMARLTFPAEEVEEVIAQHTATAKQSAVLRLLAEVGDVSQKELCYFAGVTVAVVSALVKKGLIELYEREVLRRPYEAGEALPPLQSATLSEEQEVVFRGLLSEYQKPEAAAALLFGVTGSGKTQVYMNLIDRVLAEGKQVLVLVPEISLTPQLLNLFLRRYGGRVAMLHSGLSIGERMDEFKRIRRGDASIVIGTRSAVFAPVDNLGLIVMDEEQEHTYKSESNPRYHARDVARFRCAKHKALLLLCSATPSVESFHAAQNGRYALFRLQNRFGEAALPEVQVADLRGETLQGSIGEQLRGAIAECLADGRQAILLLNRRGYNTHVTCPACGYVATCPFCSVSMTYHRANDRLVCHYCGHMQGALHQCPTCGSDKIRYGGLGTQRVEDEVKELFPEAAVLRMDADTTLSRFAYEQKFSEFAEGQYDIMIGTQMVAKGLDFPRVGLVGVLSADNSLYGGDYRSFETTFALLTQVIGRAGRRDVTGRAVIQTYTPENYVIDLASRQD
ncbi:MAG: primosomal protein N', partial [Clostridia bacterium]|nr:primosomal protein N' [Clostridia bacterium]